MWKVFYRGVPKVCYRCLNEGHLGRDCVDNSVMRERLASRPEFYEAPAEKSEETEKVPKTWAQVLKDKSFTAKSLVREQTAKQRQETSLQMSFNFDILHLNM